MEAGERERGKQRQALRSSKARDITQVERWNLKYGNQDVDKLKGREEEQQDSSCPWITFTKSCTDSHHPPAFSNYL